MATTFILPFAMGACEAMGGNVMTDAFGIVAMIAMTPLISIQVLGLIGKTRQDRIMKRIHMEFEQIDDGMVYYNDISKKYTAVDNSNIITYTMEETLHGN
jgi:hydroxymethylglutaryl-CoA reductase